MNTLHDVLAERAEAITDTEHHDRVAAVRRRIAVARNRRRAAVAGIAAAVVAVAGVALTLPHGHQVQPADAPSRMVGHAVPRTTVSLGATYRYTRGEVGNDGHVAVTLPASNEEYLVRMASTDPHGQLSLSQPGQPDAWVTPAGDFGAFYELSTDRPTRVSVKQRGGNGDVAVAVYSFDRAAPGSYEKDGIVFAPNAAGQPLLGAWVGDAGVSAHTLRLPALPPRIDVHPVCGKVPHGTGLRITFVGRSGLVSEGTSCEGAPEHLPGEYASTATVHVPNGATALRIEAVDAHERPVSLPGDSRIGMGVYATAYIGAQHGLTRFVDSGGHRWKLIHTYVGPVGQKRASSTIDAREPALVSYGSLNSSKGMLIGTIGKHDMARLSGGGFSWGVVADGRRDTVVRLHYRDGGPMTQLVIGQYAMAD